MKRRDPYGVAKAALLNAARRKLGLGQVSIWTVCEAIGKILGQPIPSGFDAKKRRYALVREFLGVNQPVAKPIHSKQPLSFNASDEFLATYEWRQLRMVVLKKRGARCECCGNKPPDVIIHVDHIKPRRHYPELALEESNLQVLCEVCNHGKGSWDETDWRAPGTTQGMLENSPVPETATATSINSSRKPRLVRRR